MCSGVQSLFNSGLARGRHTCATLPCLAALTDCQAACSSPRVITALRARPFPQSAHPSDSPVGAVPCPGQLRGYGLRSAMGRAIQPAPRGTRYALLSSQRPQSASASSSLARRSGSPRSMAPRQPQIEGRYFTRYLSPSLPTVLSPRSPSRRISERPRRCKRDTRPIPRTVGPNKNTCSVEVSPHALFAQRA